MGDQSNGPAIRPGTRARRSDVQPPCGPFRVRNGVLATRAPGCIVLMSPAVEQYMTLTAVAVRIWELLPEGLTLDAMADRLYDEYDTPRWLIWTDLAAELTSWLQQGLIEPATLERQAEPQPCQPTSAPATEGEFPAPIIVPSVLRCGLLLLAIRVMLRVRGFVSTMDWIRGRVDTTAASTSATMEAVRAVQWPLAMAAALYPGRARCLEQSLVLYYLLRRDGIAVRYCQGVKPFPFQAHAWIEYRGEPINDVPEHADQFARLPDQLP
jgi:hypothetical protein